MSTTALILGGKHHGHWLVAGPHMRSVRLACPETVAQFASYGMGGPDDCSLKTETYVRMEFATPQRDFVLWRLDVLSEAGAMELLISNFPKQAFIHV